MTDAPARPLGPDESWLALVLAQCGVSMGRPASPRPRFFINYRTGDGKPQLTSTATATSPNPRTGASRDRTAGRHGDTVVQVIVGVRLRIDVRLLTPGDLDLLVDMLLRCFPRQSETLTLTADGAHHRLGTSIMGKTRTRYSPIATGGQVVCVAGQVGLCRSMGPDMG